MPTVKPISITDNTAAGAEAFLQTVLRDVRDIFRRRGEFIATVFMVGDRDPHTSATLDKPTSSVSLVDPSFLQDNDTKNSLVVTMNELAVAAGAFGLAFVVEMWMKWFEGDTASKDMATFRSEQRSLNDDANAAGRKEGILVAFEHQAREGCSVKADGRLRASILWAEIHRPGRGKPHLGPWQAEVRGFEGRFTGLLPDDDYMNRAAEALDAMRAFAKQLGMSQSYAAEVIARGRLHRPGYPPPKWLAQRLREMEW